MNSIFQWCGRFGNNIQQLSNAIFFAKSNNYFFSSPEHELIKSFNLNFGNKNCPCGLYFFHVDSETKQGPRHFDCNINDLKIKRKEICENYINPNLKFNISDYEPLKDDTVVIHIRGGDIFSRKNYYCPVISRYIQNPLIYYKWVIDKFEKAIILTEDYSNPTVKHLEKYQKVNVKISSLEDSLITLLRSKNIATGGISSFPIAAALLSKNLKNLYTTNLVVNEILNQTDIQSQNVKINTFNLDFNKYISGDQWLNTEEQRELMISYE